MRSSARQRPKSESLAARKRFTAESCRWEIKPRRQTKSRDEKKGWFWKLKCEHSYKHIKYCLCWVWGLFGSTEERGNESELHVEAAFGLWSVNNPPQL